MDKDAIEYTRQHYDAHANTMSMAEALRSRSEGAALPLKQYHNSIKRELINAFAGGPGASLLDLACGRGGDIWKWMDAGLSYVLGVDLSPGEVAEAARRFEEAKAKRAKGGGGGGRGSAREQRLPPCRLEAEFRECSTLGLEPFSAEPPEPSSGDDAAAAALPPAAGGGGGGGEKGEGGDEEANGGGDNGGGGRQGDGDCQGVRKRRRERRERKRRFDSVSCMFAAHYFCSSEAALSTFLANVARNLRPGGFFFGTVPSGKKVMAAIKEGGTWPHLATPMLRLEGRWKGAPTPFGSGYTCAIGDTVTSTAAGAGKDEDEGEEEAKEGEEGKAGAGKQSGAKRKRDDGATEQGSFEYLVFSSAFSAVAARHGLSPFPRWGAGAAAAGRLGGRLAAAAAAAAERLLDPADEGSHFKSFAPHFPGSDPSLERASELFQAFVFVKDADKEGGDEDLAEEEEEEKEEEEKAEEKEEEKEKEEAEKAEEEEEEKAEEAEAGKKRKRRKL